MGSTRGESRGSKGGTGDPMMAKMLLTIAHNLASNVRNDDIGDSPVEAVNAPLSVIVVGNCLELFEDTSECDTDSSL